MKTLEFVRMAEGNIPVVQLSMWVLDDSVQSLSIEWWPFYTAFTHATELKLGFICFTSQLETGGCIFS